MSTEYQRTYITEIFRVEHEIVYEKTGPITRKGMLERYLKSITGRLIYSREKCEGKK